ncbi:MAG TPA: RdgB/HAM1 family non-canonical purine NTP pyrophosphatase [Bryobacteraceae bacterium]|nr:RdgB/HAM1 family non-canonical purine NTP pyrophosphatase [Bryobacteraceae bacterium]
MIRLWCATGNPGKLREFRLAALHHPEFQIDLLPDFRLLPPCEEDGHTFEQNAIKKARHYAPHAPGMLFADDSGLEVDALAGAPGVYSARFAGASATDEANNSLLLEKLRGSNNRRARFVCTIALASANQSLAVFRGAVEGEIAAEPRGSSGFGYDPLFFYRPFECTFGEATADQKFSVSHRGQALRAMLEYVMSL